MTTEHTQWGVFHDAQFRQHVAPCDAGGFVAHGHRIDGDNCWCEPVRDPVNLIVHNHLDKRMKLH